MSRLVPRAASWTVFLMLVTVLAASAQTDLVVQKTDISVSRSEPGNVTYVTVTVRNPAAAGAGPFTLRVGASMAGASTWSDFAITGLPAGQSVSRTANFQGTAWKCGWGNADLNGTVTEQSESNNCASRNDYWIAIGPGNSHDETIGVINPGLETEQVLLTVAGPPGWIVTVEPNQFSLAPETLRDAVVHFFAPQDFRDQVTVNLYAVFTGGTPGMMEWNFRMETAVPVESKTWGGVKALFGE
jgi:hypothetical protein